MIQFYPEMVRLFPCRELLSLMKVVTVNIMPSSILSALWLHCTGRPVRNSIGSMRFIKPEHLGHLRYLFDCCLILLRKHSRTKAWMNFSDTKWASRIPTKLHRMESCWEKEETWAYFATFNPNEIYFYEHRAPIITLRFPKITKYQIQIWTRICLVWIGWIIVRIKRVREDWRAARDTPPVQIWDGAVSI